MIQLDDKLHEVNSIPQIPHSNRIQLIHYYVHYKVHLLGHNLLILMASH